MPSFLLELNHKAPVVGLDEVGCGPWAGPVVAAAFTFLTHDIDPKILEQIKDSKKITPKARSNLWDIFHKDQGHLWDFAIAEASVEEIDSLNIKKASMKAMGRAFADLHARIPLSYALVDGVTRPDLTVPLTTVVKGDDTSYSIAAASIVAKVHRDRLMEELDRAHPVYGWAKNAGYGTRAHQEALEKHGVTQWHRRSFKPIQALLRA